MQSLQFKAHSVCIAAHLLQHKAISSLAVKRPRSRASVSGCSLSAPSPCLLPSAPPRARVSLLVFWCLYLSSGAVTLSHSQKNHCSSGANGEAGSRVRHFLCDRKLTTNTQKPTGGGVNEKGRDKALQMFDGALKRKNVIDRKSVV